MQNDRSKFKEEFKGCVYRFALEIIAFVEELPKGQGAEMRESKRERQNDR